MTANKQATIAWFDSRKGRLTYSMTGSRNGSDGTADCSGSITQAIRDAGGIPYEYLYSTVTLASYLANNGYKRISVNQDWDAAAGDIIQMSWGNDMSTSGGAGGHVGVMKDSIKFISTDYWTGGVPGTAVSEHNWNDYYAVQRPNYVEVWRKEVSGSANSNNGTNTTNENQEELTMIILESGKAQYYFNGKTVTTLSKESETNALGFVYKSAEKKNIPVVKVTADQLKNIRNVLNRKPLS